MVKGYEYVEDATGRTIFVDAIRTGISAKQLLEIVRFTTLNASSEVYVINASGTRVADGALVGSGCSVVVDAVSKQFIIQVIIVGDLNGNGEIDAQDAAIMASVYCEKSEFTPVQNLAYDTNNNNELDAQDAARNAYKFNDRNWNQYESKYKND